MCSFVREQHKRTPRRWTPVDYKSCAGLAVASRKRLCPKRLTVRQLEKGGGPLNIHPSAARAPDQQAGLNSPLNFAVAFPARRWRGVGCAGSQPPVFDGLVGESKSAGPGPDHELSNDRATGTRICRPQIDPAPLIAGNVGAEPRAGVTASHGHRARRLQCEVSLREGHFIRLYFFNAATTRSPGRPNNRMPSAPVIVGAASIALTTASSVASMVA